MRSARRSILVLCCLVLLSAGAWTLRVRSWRALAVVGDPPRDGYTRAAGVIHVHSTHSDGSGSVAEVVAAARRNGLQFVVVTDHNNLDAKPEEGYHGGVLLLVGTEVSTASGYVLGLGIPDPAFRFSGDARDALDDIRQLGGSSYAAHPTSARPEFTWRGWDLAGSWGLEVVNLDCQWRDAGWARLLRAAAAYPLNPRYSLLGLLSRPASVIDHWDTLLRKRHTPAIAAADAHGRIPLPWGAMLRLPSYEALLGIAETHVLLETPLSADAARDGSAIFAALAAGRSYVGIDAIAPANGFFFEAVAGEQQWVMGETVPAGLRSRLRSGGQLPPGSTIVLLRDGRQVTRAEAALDLETPGPGSYRVEVYVRGWMMPWILSNPIYVFDGTQSETRRRNALPALAPAAPSAARLLDDFETGSVFHAEFDPSSSLEAEILDPAAPFSGRSAGRMSFRLGDGGGRQGASCALVTRERRNWSGASGLAFAIRGDADYRVHVQIRDENRAGRDEGTETWFASTKAGPAWQRRAIPFAAFHSTDPHSDGQLDLEKVRLVAFVVDRAAEKVGTRGTIWLDEVGVY